MKRNLKLWLLLVGIFCFVLCATIVSCDKEAYEAKPIRIETPTTPPSVPPEVMEVRCCSEADGIMRAIDAKNDKTEDED